ncbi:hypothetical protein [Pyrococcus kukulkanii]|uniref:hypothetical protein n=1 Tax=Pyrococcus kukulkanii TaxID=1609559 RepID=UPI00356A6985
MYTGLESQTIEEADQMNTKIIAIETSWAAEFIEDFRELVSNVLSPMTMHDIVTYHLHKYFPHGNILKSIVEADYKFLSKLFVKTLIISTHLSTIVPGSKLSTGPLHVTWFGKKHLKVKAMYLENPLKTASHVYTPLPLLDRDTIPAAKIIDTLNNILTKPTFQVARIELSQELAEKLGLPPTIDFNYSYNPTEALKNILNTIWEYHNTLWELYRKILPKIHKKLEETDSAGVIRAVQEDKEANTADATQLATTLGIASRDITRTTTDKGAVLFEYRDRDIALGDTATFQTSIVKDHAGNVVITVKAYKAPSKGTPLVGDISLIKTIPRPHTKPLDIPPSLMTRVKEGTVTIEQSTGSTYIHSENPIVIETITGRTVELKPGTYRVIRTSTQKGTLVL